MMELTDLLREAAADPPPTNIDVDALLAGHRGGAARRRWLAGGGAALLAVAATVGVVMLVRAPGGTGQPAPLSPSPTPTPCAPYVTLPPAPTTPAGSAAPDPAGPGEPVAVAVPRLSAVLREALAAALPDAEFVDPFSPCEPVRFRADVFDLARYYAVAEVSDADGAGGIEVMIGDRPITPPDIYPDHVTLDDGTVVGSLVTEGTRDGDHVRQNNVSIVRPDGTAITLIATNVLRGNYAVATRPTAPATVDQLTEIGTTPGLTLTP
jgi:hypothetical protein